MDPLSLTVATATLLDLSIKVSGAIIGYADKVQNPDKCINFLRVEIDSLSSLLKSFNATLRDPMTTHSISQLETRHDGEYWQHVRLSIGYCQQTIEGLEDILDKVMGSRKGLVGRMIRPVRLGLKTEDIAMYRQQIISYREAIGLALQWISVHVPLPRTGRG